MLPFCSRGSWPTESDAGDERRRKLRVTSNESDALTIGEAADRIRVSRRHLQKLMAEGHGPPVVSLGRRKIIRREALLQWLVSREGNHAAGL